VHRLFKTVLLISLVTLLAIFPTIQAIAQTAWDIRVNLVATVEKSDGMNLKLYFNVVESQTSAPILDLNPKSAQVQMLNSDYIADGEVKKPDVPIYIVMVLDSSGSMGGAASDLQKAAKQALNNVPDNSLFSVVQFDETIKLLQDFTQNIPAVSYAIDQYKVSNKGTCLYDAAYSAAEALQKAPAGRRAIILFTDGKDENVNGKQCSKHSYQELVDLAMKNQVPINTIGLSYKEAGLNELELKSMAASTGGFSAIASKDDLAQSFQNIMDALKSQWMVETTIYPKRGQNDGVLTLRLQDDKTLTVTFSVTSNTDYPGPPSPVTVSFAGLQLNAAKQSYEVQLSMTSPDLASYVKIAVWDKEGGSKVGEYVFNNPVDFNTFLIPTESLTVGRGYELRITAINKKDNTPFQISRDSDGKPLTEMIHEFNFDPSSAYPNLQVQSIVEQKGDLVLTVAVTNPDLIGGFDGWLVDENTNTQVPNSKFTTEALTSTNGTITVPTKSSHIPDGKYTVVVRVLAKNNNVYSTATYSGVAYKAPTLFERLGVALFAAPIFLFAIVAIVLALVGFLMFNSSRQKAMSGTPVLQGQLGGKLKGSGKGAGPVIPIADDEPIPSRGKAPSSPSAPASTPFAPSPPASRPSTSQPISSLPPTDATVISGIPAGGAANDGATMIASAPVMPRVTLTITRAPATLSVQGRTFNVDQFPYVIGRSESTLTITDPNISRKHAQITRGDSPKVFFITDLNSSNGVRLNGQRISSNQMVQLNSGTEIELGPNVSIRFDVS
jgi:VWFA-related protein